MTQGEALEVMKTGVNVFLTGAPGTGKTYTINAYIKWLKERAVEPSVTASTGIAATHIGGRTIHSFIGIGVVDHLDDYVIDTIMQRESLYKRLTNAKVLIIDEISMLDSKVLDKINIILQGVRRVEKPFGGLQVIFVGDFFQLPPVARNGEQKKFAYESLAWRDAKPLVCYLEEQFRQNEEILLDLLLSIRNRTISSKHKTFLEERIEVTRNLENDSEMTRLYTHNLDVDKINNQKLQELETKEFEYEMKTVGSRPRVEALQKSCLAPADLRLKVGAKVMFVKNDMEGQYVNGTIGVVINLSMDKIKVALKSGKIVEVKHAEWALEEDGKVKAKLIQYPLRLAWAVTVHKSQGMSLDEAYISLKDTFEYGQGYVALSRVRSLDGLYLQDINEISLEVHGGVFGQDKKFKEASQVVADRIRQTNKQKLKSLQDNFILSCGGNLDVSKTVSNKQYTNTLEETRDLFVHGFSVNEIAEKRELKRETVAKHIEELVLTGDLQKEDVQKAFDKLLPIPKKVSTMFEKYGLEKLTPVYKALDAKHSFDDLRIYRMLMRFDL